MENNGVLKRHT